MRNGRQVFWDRNALEVEINGDRVDCPQCEDVNILPWELIESGGLIECSGCSSYFDI